MLLQYNEQIVSAEPKVRYFGSTSYGVKGSTNPACKFTPDQVLEIVALRMEEKLLLKEIAKRYNVAISTIHNICVGNTYTDVTGIVYKSKSKKRKLKKKAAPAVAMAA